MIIIERENITKLYDVYQGLLTSKQREYFEAYYFDDLSIGEIAENYNISRNGVFDQIRKVVAILSSYEEKLQIARKNDQLTRLLEEADIEIIKKEIKNIIEE